MAFRLLAGITGRQILAGGAALGGTGLAGSLIQTESEKLQATEAQVQFHTSSIHPTPVGYSPWQIRNDYPTSDILKANLKAQKESKDGSLPHAPSPLIPAPGLPGDFEGKNAPWFKFDYEKEPEKFAEAIREYCFDGNVEKGFRLNENTVRDWYHAPWMHYRDPDPKSSCTEREPINGFTFERATPPGEFAKTQNVALQNWAVGFYNATGATVFGDMWKDPDNPDFSQNKEFPVGTCVFKILLNNSTPEQMPIQDGAPTMDAVISKSTNSGRDRNDFASPLRLIQVDFAVVDKRSPIGWVFGTFMYNKDHPGKGPWDRLTLVGLQWGNDHWLTNKVYEETKAEGHVAKPRECYINPEAEKIRKREGGTRPSWGWNGRMNGPADNFISACASCHSTSTSHPMYNGKVKDGVKQVYGMVPPLTMAPSPQPKPGNTFSDVMIYFRNVMGGVPFDEGVNPKNPDEYDPTYKSKVKSADYSLQLQVGWANYKKWKEDHETLVQSVFRKTRYVIGSELAGASDLSQRDQGRQEPTDDGPVE
ncbi:hypothetical protein FPRO06_07355 [Fusarium proliferatum]|uniref:Cytochrome c domain-containing protein n=2 Tax=Gibberella intermedia TaxID=948311 RepID=A0A1L7VBG8_FUSPR|nr:uncharacterized protein FPRO_06746 [Fusarium proliferatum ET1]KAG4255941.1 hypothetical protein FPRO03_04889 [Fusarium proliferatum]KAG4286095.1 hypothetical protein FPRO06_07355 [Fusarium proliferatum]RBA20736.1 hypothetical protein FPRO05_08183 [Fusarium proliferatum]CVK85547.1 uncharacterized protein FPRN_06576 [Fusarium proliferatum]CZR38063.1 uncharacterized protein FPRO_06746 [Fusarium proliferatum ET1]